MENNASLALIRDHYQYGFIESQRIIQFQDTKAWKVLSIATLIFGGTLALVRWIFEFETSNGQKLSHKLDQFNCFWIIVAVAILIFFVGALGCTILFCQQCVMPRPPKETPEEHINAELIKLPFSPNILFPYHNPDCPNQLEKLEKRSRELLKRSDNDPVLEFIQMDYEHQSKQLGRILFIKIDMVNKAIRSLFWELFASITIISGSVIFLISQS
jgi:hypothetical protein